MNLVSIGIIHTPFERADDMPIQSLSSQSQGQIILDPELTSGLKDLEEFSHIYLLYFLHLSKNYDLEVIPFLDSKAHGVFATRAPRRPNPIGLSIVKLISIDQNIIHFKGADMHNETPLLDIKPYTTKFDQVEDVTNGWVKANPEQIRNKRSDKRFT